MSLGMAAIEFTGPNVVTIPGHYGDDVAAGTLKSILKAAGLENTQ
jgi:predicted RNA binding protein YcfA (HicA-like mRNA interferase family)